jgi:hypothetical protein
MRSFFRTARSELTAAAGVWTTAGDLPFAGFWAQPSDAAVMLDDNRGVLLAGGEDGRRTPLDKAAVFDPVALTWSTTGSLLTARRLHTITKLKDGTVLAVGGITGPPPAQGVATAEIYDPVARSWRTTGGLREARFGHSASLLPDGTVLVAGGSAARSADSNRALRTCEIFNPATEQWTPAASLNDARFGHPAVVLNDHRVLVVGGVVPVGRGRYAALGYCEIYDLDAKKWVATGSLASPRKSHQATVLSDGTVLATGGDITGIQNSWTFNPYSLWSAEVFTVASGTWSAVPDMPYGRSHHRAVPVGAKALIIGGTDDSSFDVGYQHSDSYDPVAKSFATLPTVVGRWATAAVPLTGGRVLLAGGITRSGAAAPIAGEAVVTAATEIFTPGT